MKRIVLLLLIGGAVYANTFEHPFIFDDLPAIADNTSIRALDSGALTPAQETPTAGRPIVNASFAINYAIGGLRVPGYHAVNLALHLLCGALMFALVRRTLECARMPDALRRRSADVAFASALLWLLHPLNTEVVDYLTQRSESLMAACYLTTLYCAARGFGLKRSAGWHAGAALACAAGMACKESMVTAPLAVLLYDRAFVSDSWTAALRSRWRLYAGLAAGWIVLAALMIGGPRARTVGFSGGVSAWTYLLNQAEMVSRYAWLTLSARSLVLAYGPPRAIALTDVLPQATFVVALVVAALVSFIRRPAAGYASVFAFLVLAPTSTIVPIVTEVGAERRMYLPLVALVAAIVVGVVVAWDRWQPKRTTATQTIALAVVAIVSATGTWTRNTEYRSALVMAETVFARWPTGFARTMVGAAMGLEGRHAGAVAELREAVKTYPPARYYLGGELFETGAYGEAIDQLGAYVRDDPQRIESVRARTLIAQAHARLADEAFNRRLFAEAEPHYRAYLESSPNDERAVTNLGVALASQGRMQEAIVQFKRAVELNPSNPGAQQNLARAQRALER